MQAMLQKVRDEIIQRLKAGLRNGSNLIQNKTNHSALGAGDNSDRSSTFHHRESRPILNIVSTALKALELQVYLLVLDLTLLTLGIGALIAIIAMALFQSESSSITTRLGETYAVCCTDHDIVDSLILPNTDS